MENEHLIEGIEDELIVPEHYDGARFPYAMRKAMTDWVLEAVPPGNFLTAVIQNNLREAVCMADDHNVKIIKQYVIWFINRTDRRCWGSIERFVNWRGYNNGSVARCESESV